MFCAHCGRPLAGSETVCPNCGMPLNTPSTGGVANPIGAINTGARPTQVLPVAVFDPANPAQNRLDSSAPSQPYSYAAPYAAGPIPSASQGGSYSNGYGNYSSYSASATRKPLSTVAKGWIIGASAFVILVFIVLLIVWLNWMNILKAVNPNGYTRTALNNVSAEISSETEQMKVNLGIPDLDDPSVPKSYSLKIDGLSSDTFDLDDLKINSTLAYDQSKSEGSLDLSLGYGTDEVNGSFYFNSKQGGTEAAAQSNAMTEDFSQSLSDFMDSLDFTQSESADIPVKLKGKDFTIMSSDVDEQDFKDMLNSMVDAYADQQDSEEDSGFFNNDSVIAFGFNDKNWSGTVKDLLDMLGIDSSAFTGASSTNDNTIEQLHSAIDDINFDSASIDVFINSSGLAQAVQVDMSIDGEGMSFVAGVNGPKGKYINDVFFDATAQGNDEPAFSIVSKGNHVGEDKSFDDTTTLSVNGTDITISSRVTPSGEASLSIDSDGEKLRLDGSFDTTTKQVKVSISTIELSGAYDDSIISGDISLTYGEGKVHNISEGAQPFSDFSEDDLSDLTDQLMGILQDNPDLLDELGLSQYECELLGTGCDDDLGNYGWDDYTADPKYQSGYTDGYSLGYSDGSTGGEDQFGSLDYGGDNDEYYQWGYDDGYLDGYLGGELGDPSEPRSDNTYGSDANDGGSGGGSDNAGDTSTDQLIPIINQQLRPQQLMARLVSDMIKAPVA